MKRNSKGHFVKGSTPFNKGITGQDSHAYGNKSRTGMGATKGSFNREDVVREKNVNWKGDLVSYAGLHIWVKSRKEIDSCEHCGVKNKKNKNNSDYLHCANISGEYKRDVDDYLILCPSCHKNYDLGNIIIKS